MPVVKRRPRAEADIESAYLWYAEHAGLTIADRFYGAVTAAGEDLAKAPLSGSHAWRGKRPSLRGVRYRIVDRTFRRWIVFYRPCAGGVEILRVLHGARDLGSALESLD